MLKYDFSKYAYDISIRYVVKSVGVIIFSIKYIQ